MRRAEQRALAAAMRRTLTGRRVLELACGTGWWTARVAPVAQRVTAVDAAPGMLALARSRGLPAERVRFVAGDAYRPAAVAGEFDGGLAAFFLSHVARAEVAGFLDRFHRRLEAGAAVFLADNVFVPGLGGELEGPGAGEGEDTYKRRRLADGSEHRVLKNYFDAADLERLLAPGAFRLRIHHRTHFWWASYRVAPGVTGG